MPSMRLLKSSSSCAPWPYTRSASGRHLDGPSREVRPRPSFHAPNIVVAEAYDGTHFQTLEFTHRLRVYKCVYAPFVPLLRRYHPAHDHKEPSFFVLQAHPVTFGDTVFQGSRDATGC